MGKKKKDELAYYIERYKEVKEDFDRVREIFFDKNIKMTIQERKEIHENYEKLLIRKDAIAEIIADLLCEMRR